MSENVNAERAAGIALLRAATDPNEELLHEYLDLVPAADLSRGIRWLACVLRVEWEAPQRGASRTFTEFLREFALARAQHDEGLDAGEQP